MSVQSYAISRNSSDIIALLLHCVLQMSRGDRYIDYEIFRANYY